MNHSSVRQTNCDLICFCHLRWDFVFQRPQHLMSRFAKRRRVFFVEEPIYEQGIQPVLENRTCEKSGVQVVTPHLPEVSRAHGSSVIIGLLARFFRAQSVKKPIVWCYTPMALECFPENLSPAALIYDCMDELSLFRAASPRLLENEIRLLEAADLVFTGGVSLFEAKRSRHPRVHVFPSGVDIGHFAQARQITEDYEEQRRMRRPRIGYAGVIDERMDLELIRDVAARRPAWQIVMIGPVVKIDPASLPLADNIHWLGMKDYEELPMYFAGWDVAMMPFALNDATRFISPTKTPEYLSAGLPVVSTPIRDVVRPYGDLGLARIATDAEEFVSAIEQAMAYGMSLKWRERADQFLETCSWDSTWNAMNHLVEEAVQTSRAPKEIGLTASAQIHEETSRV